MFVPDIGDLTLDESQPYRHQQLFHAIRKRILNGQWPAEARLPATRLLSNTLGLSRNTVCTAYDQLLAEGYITAKRGSGYYINARLPEHFTQSTPKPPEVEHHPNRDESMLPTEAQCLESGVPDLRQFPYRRWQRLIRDHLNRPALSGTGDSQGLFCLRQAIARYLSASRSVRCSPDNILVTHGAQEAMSITALALLQDGDKVLMEEPGYLGMKLALGLKQLQIQPAPVTPSGWNINKIVSSDARALYLSPSNQCPTGVSLNTTDRVKLIDWARQNQSWIIEDDYDSEFQYGHRPFTSMQGLESELASESRVIYVGSFSKVLLNDLRVGYMVVPHALLNQFLQIKRSISGFQPKVVQAALAEFIDSGGLMSHIRAMRRLYQEKHRLLSNTIKEQLGSDVTIVSQQAGMHLTLIWKQGPDESAIVALAKQEGIKLRSLGQYYHLSTPPSQGLVLGFGNLPLEQCVHWGEKLANWFKQAK